MAPEVLLGKGYSMACDVYSFGVVCWEVATGGRVPYPDMPVLQAVIQVAQARHAGRYAVCC